MTLARRLIGAQGGGGSGVPDYNDEFNGGNRDWIVVGTADFSETTPGNVHIETASRMIRLRVPPVPFTVEAHCSYLLFDDIDSVFGAAMLAVGGADNAGTTGDRHYALQWDIAFLGEIGIIDGVWSNYSTQVHQNHYIELGGIEWEIPHYQRLVVTSGHNISLYYSVDGEDWETYIENYDPNVDVDAVLLLSYGATTEWDWIRFT